MPRTSCALFREGVVEHRQTQLCKTVCMSKNPIRMLSRFIESIITAAAYFVHRTHPEIAPRDVMIRVTLQRDDAVAPARSSQPYLFDVDAFRNTLDLELLMSPDHLLPVQQIEIPYRVGEDTLDLSPYIGPTIRRRLYQDVLATLQDSDGQAFSLCLSLPDLGGTDDFVLDGIDFKHVYLAWWTARPVYLFVMAYN